MLAAALLVIGFTVSVFAAAGASNPWTFTKDAVSDPISIGEYFDTLPRAFEADVNFPQGSYSSASPIISNYPNSDTRPCFGFEINASGNPAIYYYDRTYDAETATATKIKDYVSFSYSVIGKGWVRLAVVNETDSGSSVYKLYVNGELKETVINHPTLHDFDPIYSQYTTRELSIGNDGKNYFLFCFPIALFQQL